MSKDYLIFSLLFIVIIYFYDEYWRISIVLFCFVYKKSEKKKLSICVYWEAKKRRIGISKTEHYTFVFSFFFLACLDEWKRRARTHLQIHREKKEKCYGETLLAIITLPTNDCALARKKTEIRENVKLTTK